MGITCRLHLVDGLLPTFTLLLRGGFLPCPFTLALLLLSFVALEKAEREHAKTAAAIQAAAEALEKRSQAEDARWAEEKDRLQAVLRRERG